MTVPSRARIESNQWLRTHCRDITGSVLSIGSDIDSDMEGDRYRNYFPLASSYLTSEVSEEFNADLCLDIRSMHQIEDASFDCVFCSGVLEHVDDYMAGMREITRILKRQGTLLLGLPFRQAIHLGPQDFWRFTEFGIRNILNGFYQIRELTAIDTSVKDFPVSYWVKARKR